MLAGLRAGEGLASFAKCMMKWVFVDGVRVSDKDVRMLFVK